MFEAREKPVSAKEFRQIIEGIDWKIKVGNNPLITSPKVVRPSQLQLELRADIKNSKALPSVGEARPGIHYGNYSRVESPVKITPGYNEKYSPDSDPEYYQDDSIMVEDVNY